MASKRVANLNSPGLDVVVIAARSEEREALKAVFEPAADVEATERARTRVRNLPVYAFLHARVGEPISVGIMECAEMGNVAAAINTAYAVVKHNPSLMIFSGIAGSLDSSKIRIGDVIFPRQIHTRYFQKLKNLKCQYADLSNHDKHEAIEAINGKLHCDFRSVEISQAARDVLNHLDSKKLAGLLENIDIPPEWTKEYRIPSRRVSVVNEETAFCWDKVLSNQKYVSFLRDSLGGNICTTVDMESYGFLRAVQRLALSEESTPQGMVVRAVSDFAEHKELSDSDPRWRALALKNMAIATLFVVREPFQTVFLPQPKATA